MSREQYDFLRNQERDIFPSLRDAIFKPYLLDKVGYEQLKAFDAAEMEVVGMHANELDRPAEMKLMAQLTEDEIKKIDVEFINKLKALKENFLNKTVTADKVPHLIRGAIQDRKKMVAIVVAERETAEKEKAAEALRQEAKRNGREKRAERAQNRFANQKVLEEGLLGGDTFISDFENEAEKREERRREKAATKKVAAEEATKKAASEEAKRKKATEKRTLERKTAEAEEDKKIAENEKAQIAAEMRALLLSSLTPLIRHSESQSTMARELASSAIESALKVPETNLRHESQVLRAVMERIKPGLMPVAIAREEKRQAAFKDEIEKKEGQKGKFEKFHHQCVIWFRQIKVAYNMHHVKNAETIATLSECYVTESGRRKEGLLVNERSALNILLMYARCLVNEFTEKSPELPFLIYLLSLRLDGTRTLFYGDHDLGIKGMRPELDTYFSVNDHKPALSFLIIENFINGLSYAAKAPLLLPASEEVRPLLFWLTKIYNAVFISENNFMPAVDTTIKNTPILFILRQQLQALAVSVMESISTDVMLQEKKNTGEMLQAIDLQLRIIIKFAEDHRINIEKEDIVGLHEEFQELSRKLQPLEEFSVAQFRAGLFFLAELRLPAPELFRRNAEELFVHVQNLRRSEKFLEVEAMVSELHDFHIEYKNSAGEEFSIGIVSAKRSLQNLIALCHQLAMASSENKLSIASILYHAKQTDVGIILPMYFPKIGDHSLIYKHKTSNRTLDAKQLLDFLESVIPQDVKLNTGRLNLLSLFQCHFLRVSFDVYSSINIYSIRITNGERPAVENWDLVKAGLQKSLLEIIEMLLNQGLSGLLDVQGLERKSVDLCRALTKLGVSINNCDPAFGAECQNVLNIKDFKVAFRAVSDELKQLPAALALKN